MKHDLSEDDYGLLVEWPLENGYGGLFDQIMALWDCSMGSAVRENTKGVVSLTLVTGGWSYNEAIISALRENVLFWTIAWAESHRGGKFVFALEGPEAGKEV